MKTIYLLRHTKSAWSDSDADDFDRPLNEQGQLNAVQIGHHLSDQKIQPDIILCSAAARTQETFSYIQSFLPATQAIEIKDALYLASSQTLMQHLENLNEAASSVMIIAHNPGLHELAINFGGRENIGVSELLNQVMQQFPSGAIATVQSTADQWKSLNQGESTLTGFVCPAVLPLHR
jgi:phosphohistidine phosphatase